MVQIFMKTFQVITEGKKLEFPHYWEMCVGSCHAYTALRADYREQLKTAHDELGFKYVRFHGLFGEWMSVVRPLSPYVLTSELEYNFVNIDNIFDFLLSIDMKPFLELGFMPSLFASGEDTCFYYKGNITPPKDYNVWFDFIESFVRHLEERYGEDEVSTWFFEVWNEPNLEHFWKSSMEEYFKLYEYTVRAVKKINSKYQVGGPATSINAWILELKDFCKKNNVPLDFISTHHYPTDDPLWKNPEINFMQLLQEKGIEVLNKYDKHIMQKMTERARTEAGKLPLYYTEWNISAILGEPLHDNNYSAAMVARILADNYGLVDGYSFWTFTDIFEEGGQMSKEFHGGFGLQTIHGIKKPVYRVFEMFHKLGHQKLDVISNLEETDDNVQIVATSSEKGIQILVYNHNIIGEDIKRENVKIRISTSIKYGAATISTIDATHTNPKDKWMEMGEPVSINSLQLEQIKEASTLYNESMELAKDEDGFELSFEISENSVALIEINE